VTIIVPTTAGGGTDIIARIICDQLSMQLGQAFVIENRPGAGLLVGAAAAAHTEPDGYALSAAGKAPRNPGRSQNSTGQSLRQRPWSA
jgi:tripartite-type tricarboxylate transporter receptor subunit TctC